MTGLDETPADAVSGALCLFCNEWHVFAGEGSIWLFIRRRRVPAGCRGRGPRRFGAYAARAQLPIGTVYVLARSSWNFICTPNIVVSGRRSAFESVTESVKPAPAPWPFYPSVACLHASFLLRSTCVFHLNVHRS